MPIGKSLKSRVIDDKDVKILMLLQDDGRMQLKAIAKKVSLSIDSVHKRIKEMIRKGVFQPGIFINPQVIGFPLIADIKIKLGNVTKGERDAFIEYLKDFKRCIELHAILGDHDFTCVLIAKDGNELEQLSTKIRQKFKEIIMDWKSFLILKNYKFEEYDLT